MKKLAFTVLIILSLAFVLVSCADKDDESLGAEDFIALYNPVAVDLRFALAMLKISTEGTRKTGYFPRKLKE